MVRILLVICVLTVTPLLAQPQGSGAGAQAPPHPQNTQAPAPVSAGSRPQLPVQPPQPVAPDAAVVTIHGLCPAGQNTAGEKSDACTVVLTRQQFETMVSSINVTNQTFTPAALRSLAAGYVTVLALADAGEKAGVDKDPRFQEFMRVARTRALADAYRRSLQEKYSNPSPEEIEAYYKQNMSKFEQIKIDRILVPKVNPMRSQDKPAEFEKKARELAAEIRERAGRGEDISSLQAEVYKSLGIQAMPPQTEMNPTQMRALQGAVQQDVNALKPGEVTKVEIELSGFNIYKLRSKNTLSLEQARNQIVHELSQKNFDAALKSATGGVHPDFNEQFFNPHPVGMGPAPRVSPGNVSTGHTGVHVNLPPPSASSAPAAGPSGPASQKPASPK